MLIHRSVALAIAFSSASLSAQNAPCAVGPGAMFGIVGYQCANCAFKHEIGGQPSYTFFSEPVVTETRPGSLVANGDVVVAVDGSPITTQAGADKFAYAPSGAHKLTVRRGREPRDIDIDVQTNCTTAAATNVRGAARATGGSIANVGGGLVALPGRYSYVIPQIYVDGIAVPPDSVKLGKFGFAVTCKPSCSATFTPAGEGFYKYDGYPPIYAIRPDSPADRAGLRRGDLILKVNGKSILDEAGILQRAEQQDQLRLTVQRDGKEINVVLVATP